ncbi:42027_t:CDS:2, partial [Gigaspora margarita]
LLFRTLSSRIPANQQKEFEHLSDSQQSESVSFVTARNSSDLPPTYEEAVQTERIRNLEGSIRFSNNQIRSLKSSIQTSNNQIISLKNINQTLSKNIKELKETI